MPYASATKPGGIGPCGFMSFLLRPARGDGDAIELAVRVARQFIPPFDGPRLHEIGEILAKPGGEPLFVGGAVPAAHDQDDRGAEPRVGHAERHHLIRSEEHTSELQSLMRISYAVFCLKKTKQTNTQNISTT